MVPIGKGGKLMIQNIFMTACYDVGFGYGNTNYEDYKKLTQICCNSFIKNLNGLTEVTVLEGKAENFHILFKDLYYRIKDIYILNQPCNILFADSDTICLKPVEIFGKFNKFSMFLIANEFHQSFGNEECRKLAQPLYPWMMANLRYYPAGLPNSIWDTPDDLAFSWIDDWAYDCIIYNSMFHSQGIENYNDYHIPEWNRLVIGGITDEQINNSSIIHCAATRGSSLSLENINKALGRS